MLWPYRRSQTSRSRPRSPSYCRTCSSWCCGSWGMEQHPDGLWCRWVQLLCMCSCICITCSTASESSAGDGLHKVTSQQLAASIQKLAKLQPRHESVWLAASCIQVAAQSASTTALWWRPISTQQRANVQTHALCSGIHPSVNASVAALTPCLPACSVIFFVLQHTPLIPMVTLVMAHGLSQDLFETYKVR